MRSWRTAQPGASPAPCLALVRSITAGDLDECAARVASWHRAGCATPLLLTKDEFAGSLDAFPIEYGEILETHRLVFGVDPFTGLTIRHRGSAARVRNARQEPPGSPARELRRVPRPAVGRRRAGGGSGAGVCADPAAPRAARRLSCRDQRGPQRLRGAPSRSRSARRRRRPRDGRETTMRRRRRDSDLPGVPRRGRTALALHRRLAERSDHAFWQAVPRLPGRDRARLPAARVVRADATFRS